MNIDSVVLTNFRSFLGRHSLNFNRFSHGVNFVFGENKQEEGLGANGAGKSSLFEAIYWCLYGKTTRNVRGANVLARSSSDPCSVLVRLGIGGKQYEIERRLKPNRLTINGEQVTQADVEQLINLTPEEFQSCILIGQFSSMFFDMQPAQRLQIFSNILDLEKWSKYGKKAAELCRIRYEQLSDLEVKYSTHCSLLRREESLYEENIEKSKNFEKERDRRIKDCEARIENILSSIKEFESSNSKAHNKIKKTKIKLRKYEAEIEDILSIKEELERERSVMRDEASRLEAEISAEERAIQDLDSIGSRCPICFNEITESHKNTEIKNREEIIERLSEKFDKLVQPYEEIKAAISEADERIRQLSELIAECKSTIPVLENSIKSNDKTIDQYKSLIEQAASEKTCVENMMNLYEEESKKNMETISSLKSKIERLSRKKKLCEKDMEAYEFWSKEFSKVRLMIIENAVSHLTLETNSILGQLGMGDWSIKFDIARETKSGSISSGFHLMVTPPGNRDPIPIECFSGGEVQRLRMATTFGLANLIQNSKGINTNIEIYDEPSQHLSEEGITDLVEFLSYRARSQRKQIWFIDHRTVNFGDFTSVITVIKDNNGSRISRVA